MRSTTPLDGCTSINVERGEPYVTKYTTLPQVVSDRPVRAGTASFPAIGSACYRTEKPISPPLKRLSTRPGMNYILSN
jgi:hypothetical protein